ncbi:C1 family peptidase [Paraglaciecola hydrolytica]|uniref:Peptidase C1A papain C-terminal domain-containing protein n=1 Tax=Paraglaciecola hydrolytica TaxID=1799789 RepID=A0A136A1Y5_9ALTE|nr:C1 family peptidase [Paraglaciecola hydrolytica]KXI29249.1 hypothetical protein AX660_13970 [Paraglaciecola hydrolytica]
MQSSFFYRLILSILLSSTILFTFVSAQEYQALPHTKPQNQSKYTLFIVSGLMQEMGIELPAPPEQKPNNDEQKDFFSDDFFADNEQSYDEIKQSMENTFADTNKKWHEEYQETVARWEKARADFLTKVEQYENATFDFDNVEKVNDPESSSPAQQNLNINTMQAGDFYVIPGALDIAIRNQASRGTCAAFAGVRAIEVVLNQNDIRKDYSEQHFYWMSKPKCKDPACAGTKENQGSSFVNGLIASKIYKTGLLPEDKCPYVAYGDPTNETQTPLSGCRAVPGVKAKDFVADVALNQLLNEISANRPVMSGFTLSDNFSLGKGFVSLADEGKYDNKRNSHSGGHAILLVGFIRLPETMASEGRFCAITANSWGDGWGRGGYGCLTENWMKKHSLGHASLQSVELLTAL